MNERGIVEGAELAHGKNGDYWKYKVNGRVFNSKEVKLEIGKAYSLEYNDSSFTGSGGKEITMKWIDKADEISVEELQVTEEKVTDYEPTNTLTSEQVKKGEFGTPKLPSQEYVNPAFFGMIFNKSVDVVLDGYEKGNVKDMKEFCKKMNTVFDILWEFAVAKKEEKGVR